MAELDEVPFVRASVAEAALRVVARLDQATTPIERIVALNSEGVIAGIVAMHAGEPGFDLEHATRAYLDELDATP